jgi:hypothetical protein
MNFLKRTFSVDQQAELLQKIKLMLAKDFV